MKLFFTKILSFFLVASILFTTTSFTVDMHFCCNKLVDKAIFGKAKLCKDQVQKKTHLTKKCSVQKKDCCDHQSFKKLGDELFDKLNSEIESNTLLFLNTFCFTYINLFEGLEDNTITFKGYRPPLLNKDIHVLLETFLI